MISTVCMQNKINFIKLYISSVFAGICISIGCTVNLLVENKYIGAFLFSIGLLAILSYNLNLYTGKVCYLLDNSFSYLCDLLVIWIGNANGTWLAALFLGQTRIYNTLNIKANALIIAKCADSLLSLFFLSIMCGICLYIAVIQYNAEEKAAFKNTIIVIMIISSFVLCGFEHSVADMFYAFISKNEAFRFSHIFVITLGNSLGSILCSFLKRFSKAQIKEAG